MRLLAIALAVFLAALMLASISGGQEVPEDYPYPEEPTPPPGAEPDWDIFPDPSPVTPPPGAEPDWDIFDGSEYEELRLCDITPLPCDPTPTPEPPPAPAPTPTPEPTIEVAPCECDCTP